MRHMFERYSRRGFLGSAASAVGLLAAPPLSEVDARIGEVMAQVVGVDMHNHVYPPGTEPHPNFGPPPGTKQGMAPPAPPHQEEQLGPPLQIAEEIKRSGITAVCCSFVLDFAPNHKPGDARDNYLHWLDSIDAELKNGHMQRALTVEDLQSAHRNGHPTIVQTVEGSHFIEGRLERIAEVYRRGLRHLQLLHDRDDMVSPLGDTNTGTPHLGGLTTFGAEVVKECNRLGILIDMAHAGHETVLGALKVSKRPLIISHTNLDTWTGSNPKVYEMMKPRLISKDHAKVVADAGGIVGVWTKLTDSVSQFVQSVKMMVDAIGVDHVGIGTDNDLLSRRTGAGTNRAWPELKTGFFYAVVAEMLRQGFTSDEVAKIGGNSYCRVFGQATAQRSSLS